MTKDCYTVHRLSEDPSSKLPKRLCMTPDEGAAKHLREIALRISLGWNIVTCVHVPPAKKLSKEALASSRTKRMKTRIRKKYGFFAEDFIAEELAAKPSYFQGYAVYQFDEWDEYEREWQSWPTAAEALGRMVTIGIPKSNPRLAQFQKRKEEMRQKALINQQKMRDPAFRAQQEEARRKRLEDEAAKRRCYEQWLMRPDRDEDSLFFNNESAN